MAIPEQIRKQTEAVQQLYTQLNQEAPAPTEPPAPAAPAPVSAPAAPAAPTAAELVPAPSDNSAVGDTPEVLQQKYKTLQGMYNAEVPRLHQQNRDLNSRIQNMEQLIASMTANQNAASAASAASGAAPVAIVTEGDVREYGESIDVMRRVTQEEVSPIVQRLSALERTLQQMQANVVPQVQAVVHKQQVTAEQQFWADLATLVPTYPEINNQPAFQAWLLELDPLTGITRQTYLDDAQSALDARRVANFFTTWTQIVKPAPAPAPTASAAPAAASELERMVAPSRSRGAGKPTAQAPGKTYTTADIQKFYADVRTGKYKGREAERNQIERDIFAAQQEGRIVTNT